MSGEGRFWAGVRSQAMKTQNEPVVLCEITSLDPFSFNYNGVDVSKNYGDNIYINSTLIDELHSFTTANAITCSDGTITENHTGIINDITTFISDVQQRIILNVNDLIAVQRLGNNSYIVINKVIQL